MTFSFGEGIQIIGGITILLIPPPYTPPAGDNVTLNIVDEYTPPLGDQIVVDIT